MDFPAILISLLPVAAFLLALVYLDSYKLIGLPALLGSVLAGLGAAAICYLVNTRLLEASHWSVAGYARYASPPLEELAKSACIILLLKTRRIGFLVDAAIYGFAVGAGFALFENLNSLLVLPDATLPVWVVRGFGTAVMHGGATAMFGILAQGVSERRGALSIGAIVAGWALATVVHSLYNHFLLSPVHSALGMMIGMPLLMWLIFQRSEKALRHWLRVGFDSDAEILAMINSGDITKTRLGAYLMSLKSRFAGEVLADLLCLLRIHVELSIRAKGILIMREAGIEVPPDPELDDKFAELAHLERTVGRTGQLAMLPFLHRSRRDLWQLTMLKGQSALWP